MSVPIIGEIDYGSIPSKVAEYAAMNLERFGEERWLPSFYSPILDQFGRPFKKVGFPTTIKLRRYSTIPKKEE